MDKLLHSKKLSDKVLVGITKKPAGNFALPTIDIDNRDLNGWEKSWRRVWPLINLLRQHSHWRGHSVNVTLLEAQHGVKVDLPDNPDTGRQARGDACIFRPPGMTVYFPGGCPTVCLHDSREGLCGIIHAGWRSVGEGIIPRFFGLWELFGGTPSTTRVTLLPSIGACCLSYRVEAFEKDVFPVLQSRTTLKIVRYLRRGDQGVNLDLIRLIQDLISQARYDTPLAPDDCTCCSDDYHCFRCDDKNGQKFRSAAFIAAT
jgi:copper oxidase (laccase) domain-containing protein